MRELTLTPRLAAVAALVPQGARLADIGTDHAYLPIHLIQTGRILSAIACDLREGPLARGRAAAQDWGVNGISFRCCDGLAGLAPDEADSVVIAGMGGETIIKILEDVSWSKREGLHVLLQPMSGVPELRQWLIAAGYRIAREVLVREDARFYLIFSVFSGEDAPYTPAELEAGRQWRSMDAPLRADYLADLIRRRRRALMGMSQGAAVPAAQLEATAALLTALEAMKEEWTAWQR